MRHLRDRVAKAIKLVFWSFFSFHLYSSRILILTTISSALVFVIPHSFPYNFCTTICMTSATVSALQRG